MDLVLQRRPTVKDTTLGTLTVDDHHRADTLEDAIREIPGVPVAEWKIKGKTAIPAGRYRLILVHSPRFGPDTLSIEGVPGFVGIRIHSGNDDADTEGCPLVGIAVEDLRGDGGNVVQSRFTLAALKATVVPRLHAGEEAWIEVRNP